MVAPCPFPFQYGQDDEEQGLSDDRPGSGWRCRLLQRGSYIDATIHVLQRIRQFFSGLCGSLLLATGVFGEN